MCHNNKSSCTYCRPKKARSDGLMDHSLPESHVQRGLYFCSFVHYFHCKIYFLEKKKKVLTSKCSTFSISSTCALGKNDINV